MLTRSRWSAAVTLAVLALLATGCAAGEAGGGSGGEGFAIASPADGATVEQPFELRFESDFELGPTSSGAHHVHVWFDGNESRYDVVESDTFQVSGLAPGKHTITASLRKANHSPEGPEDEIEVIVSGSGDGDGGGGGDGYGGAY